MSIHNVTGPLGLNHSKDHTRAEYDYYATCPQATEQLLKIEELNQNIWECAAGGKHIADVLTAAGKTVRCSDIIDRTGDIEVLDFLSSSEKWHGDIVTNPPFKYADEFIYKALDSVDDGAKVCMFLKVQFLEGLKRRKLFDKYPPARVWAASGRLWCGKNGMFSHRDNMVAYAWYVWIKGYKGITELRWFN